MNRLDEIRSHMEEYIKEQVEKIHLNSISSEVKNVLMHKIKQILDSSDSNDKIMICYLHSSIAEEKCELCLFAFKEAPFIVMPENELYVDYSEILNLPVDITECLEKEIRKKFVRLCPYEIEEIRREFMFRCSADIGRLLKGVFKEEGNIQIFFGAYMGEYEEIGRTFI